MHQSSNAKLYSCYNYKLYLSTSNYNIIHIIHVLHLFQQDELDEDEREREIFGSETDKIQTL